MRISDKEMIEGMKNYIKYLKDLPPEEAKSESLKALIRTGVLNEDGTPKKCIVTRI